MNSSGGELFAEFALREIPKLLTLQNRNPHSSTYGCFDRNHWHYKIADFPCGMSQEFVWPLALALDSDCPGNPYRDNRVIGQYVRAGILFAARSSHSDGSCDDYFPNERALGASAFSLLACAEAYQLIGMQSDEALEFFRRRARWLSLRYETGRLSNHHALVALCLDVVSRLCKIDNFAAARDERLSELLSVQYNPFLDSRAARQRRTEVLQAMVQADYITQAQANAAAHQRLLAMSFGLVVPRSTCACS